jgi:hypothetical protein
MSEISRGDSLHTQLIYIGSVLVVWALHIQVHRHGQQVGLGVLMVATAWGKLYINRG